MRKFLCFFLFFLILTGCGQTEVPADTQIPTTTAETSVPEIIPETVSETTQAPDPLLLLMEDMTLGEKVGQVFLIRCNRESALSDIATYHPGGLVLFAPDFENQTPDSVRQTLAAYQQASELPLLLSVDEEGGTVTRISRYPAFRDRRFPSPRESYAQGGITAALENEGEKCRLLKDLGLNVNIGPVCDLSDDPAGFMYQRSIGLSPESTGEFIAWTVGIMDKEGIGSVLKHFPGYGNNADTHVGMARDSRSLKELEDRDLVPFAYGIQAGCSAILVSHTIVEALDDVLPASLSPAVHGYLRETMGFDGVIITDDLVMQAITDSYGAPEAAVMALQAGNDLLCATDYPVQYEAVLAAVEDGSISMEMLDGAVYRVLKWKFDLGIL